MSSLARQFSLRLTWGIRSLGDWLAYRKHESAFRKNAEGKTVQRIDTPKGERKRHVYEVAGTDSLTTFGLHQRHAIVDSLYPKPLTSLLDIGCCRGWFVLKAAEKPTCERATGIDVVEGFIEAAQQGKALLKADKVDFHYAFLDDLLGDPVKFRTPYQVVLLLNTYHYMYWGSDYSPRHWADHEFLLKSLASVCTDRIIFMTPLEVDECPGDIKERAKAHPDWGAAYTEENFMRIASKYFDVTPHGHMGERPLYLMIRNGTPAV
ncbi:MAG TPA: class I SAM-dependent methyltransferase [Tepidisphaeraceae bacterium]|jgi:SAM-dependent methyltransferase